MALNTYAQLQADVDTTWGTQTHLKQPALDALESQMRVVGAMELGAGPIVEALDTNFEVLDSYDTVLYNSNVTMTPGTGLATIQTGGAGFYQVNFGASITANQNFNMEMGAAIPGTTPSVLIYPLKNNEVVNVSAGFVVAVANGDDLGILIRATSGTPIITVGTCNLDVYRIG